MGRRPPIDADGPAGKFETRPGWARRMERLMVKLPALAGGAAVALALAGGCTPTVQLAAPDKPITINLNVKIDQEVRVRIDKDLEDLIAQNPDLF